MLYNKNVFNIIEEKKSKRMQKCKKKKYIYIVHESITSIAKSWPEQIPRLSMYQFALTKNVTNIV